MAAASVLSLMVADQPARLFFLYTIFSLPLLLSVTLPLAPSLTLDNLRHNEAKRSRASPYRPEMDKVRKAASHSSLHPLPLHSPPRPRDQLGRRAEDLLWTDCRQCLGLVSSGDHGRKPCNWFKGLKDARLDKFTFSKKHLDPARIPPGSRLLRPSLRP